MFGWLIGNPITSLLGVSLLALGIALGVQTFRIESFKAELATANQHVSEANARADQINDIYAQNDAKNERARAEAAQKQADELKMQYDKAQTLQATLNQKQRDYDLVSSKLKGAIANAPMEDSRALGPTMRDYFSGLRVKQSEWHQDSNAPARD